MRRIDLARGVLFTTILVNSLQIGSSLTTTCSRVKQNSCFLPGNEDKKTSDEFCATKYAQCASPQWETLLAGTPTLNELECGLADLQNRGYSQSSMASMIHMRQIVQSLKMIRQKFL